MSRRGVSSPAVGAEDFLAKYAPNLSLKERGSLTSLVRVAVRDYMEENRLTQPPLALTAASLPRRPAFAVRGGRRARTPASRPRTARGFAAGAAGDSAGEEEEEAEEDNFQLVGSSTGIPTDTPRYAMVSPKYAPLAAATAAAVKDDDGNAGELPNRRQFPGTLMGFVSQDARLASDAAAEGSPEKQQVVKPQPPTPIKKRPVTANWLTWRATTPFYANDRDLRAFRHQQNPKKPMPEELPHLALYKRSARPLTARELSAAPTAERSPIGSSIVNWVHGASEHDKMVAYNLLKAMESGRTGGLEGFNEAGLIASSSARRPEGHTFGRRTRPPTPLGRRLPETGGGEPMAGFSAAARRQRVHQLGPQMEYVHPGSGFCNASPPYRSNFAVHPDWVSEQAAPPMATVAPPRRAPLATASK